MDIQNKCTNKRELVSYLGHRPPAETAGHRYKSGWERHRCTIRATMTAATSLLLLLLSVGALGQSCVGRCGVDDGVSSCQCNTLCSKYHDCCDDYETVCKSCKGRCGESYLHSKPCQCNNECESHSNCCGDYSEVCRDVTDSELHGIMEALFDAEVNSVFDQLVLDHQGQGSSGDLAPGPLFVSVPESALSGPTITLLIALQDNYNPSVYDPEDQTKDEIAEQNAFLDAIMSTTVMKEAEDFLHSKSLLTGSLRDKLDKIWFTLYEREGVLSSSGFEHTFVGELTKTEVTGFHNWVKFQEEEAKGELNYLGYLKPVYLGSKGEVLANRFEWMKKPKEVGSMFVGTSPELEMAVYTVCFLARPDKLCSVQMNNKKFNVQTWQIHDHLVGSAYPKIT